MRDEQDALTLWAGGLVLREAVPGAGVATAGAAGSMEMALIASAAAAVAP